MSKISSVTCCACSLSICIVYLFQNGRYRLGSPMVGPELKAKQGSHGRRPLLLIQLRMRADLPCRAGIGPHNSHPDPSGITHFLAMISPLVLDLIPPAMITGDDKRGLVPVSWHGLDRIP